MISKGSGCCGAAITNVDHSATSRSTPSSSAFLPKYGLWATLAFLSLFSVSGCTNKASIRAVPAEPHSSVPKEQLAEALSNVSRDGFDDALKTLASADKKGGWNDATCRRVATAFAKSASQFTAEAETLTTQLRNASASARPQWRQRIAKKRRAAVHADYNQALTLQRCGRAREAIAKLDTLLKRQPDFAQARVRRVRLLLASETTPQRDEAKLRAIVAQLQQAVRSAHFKNTEALVLLATMQMKLGKQNNKDARELLTQAHKNLQRALAVDDNHLPAYNQLALYYLQRAQLQQNGTGNADQAMLEMAELICAQALRRKPGFAPIHNTIGVIAAQRGDLSRAARAFLKARQLAPQLFEAQMNYAAVNLQFRGFDNARTAYQQALKQRPKDYDAMIGLALALRGMAGLKDEKPLVARSRKLLLSARKLNAARPESYLNEAILILEFDARYLDTQNMLVALRKARKLLATFLVRSKDLPRYAAARERAQGRIADIDQLGQFHRNQPTQMNSRAAKN